MVKSDNFRFLILLIIGFGLLISCDINSIDNPLFPSHAMRLLASDSVKHWNRIARTENNVSIEFDDCTTGTTISFWSYQSQYDLYLVGKLSGCDPNLPADTLIRANWTADGDINGEFTNLLTLTNATPAITQINVQLITSTDLQIEYEDGGVIVNESFTYESPLD